MNSYNCGFLKYAVYDIRHGILFFQCVDKKKNTKRTSFDYSIIVNKCISLEVQHIFYHLRLPIIASDLLGFFCSSKMFCFSVGSDLEQCVCHPRRAGFVWSVEMAVL